ncbi:MAG: hypothetical protein HRU09_19405 [Oligoflexales bacterium]|nr:hypothetical protein [Oligoflexales bacterium]
MSKLLAVIAGFIVIFKLSTMGIEQYNKSKSEYRFNQKLNVLLLKGTSYDTAVETLNRNLAVDHQQEASTRNLKTNVIRKIDRTKELFLTFYKSIREDLLAKEPNDDFMNFMVGNG